MLYGGLFMTAEEVRKQQKIISIGKECIKTGATVRQLSKRYETPKTTVHKYLTHDLPKISRRLAKDVRRVLDKNKSERHIRGGAATRKKYCDQKSS